MNSTRVLSLFALALCVSQTIAVCYLEDSADTCSVCWKTTYGSKDDKVGVTKMAECPESIKANYDTALPLEIFEGTEYPVTFSLTVDKAEHAVVAQEKGEVPHANIHSCISSRGACTPFVSNTPGLATHTPALNGDFDGNKATFVGTVELPVDTYTIIAHVRFFEENPDVPENPSKYDVAVGVQREVLPQVNEISAEAYIMAGVVGAILLLCGAMIWYAVRSGKLDLDYIMELLFSDYVTLPSDIICGLADAAAFTLCIVTTVITDNDLTHIVPICWMFAALSYGISLYCAYYDYYQIWDLYQSAYDEKAYDERMVQSLSQDWVARHQPKEAKITTAEKKNVRRRVSQEWDIKRMNSLEGVHHQTMVDYDMAMQDFSRRRRTVASIILESVPITAIQTYILIEGGTSTVSTLALLLASLLLGSKVQGLGDYGNARRRRNETQEKFDQMFGGVDRLMSAHEKVTGDITPPTLKRVLPPAMGLEQGQNMPRFAPTDVSTTAHVHAHAEMFVSVPSSGGVGVVTAPRHPATSVTNVGMLYDTSSGVQSAGLPAPLFTPRPPSQYPAPGHPPSQYPAPGHPPSQYPAPGYHHPAMMA